MNSKEITLKDLAKPIKTYMVFVKGKPPNIPPYVLDGKLIFPPNSTEPSGKLNK